MQRFPSRIEWSKKHIGLPSPEVLHQEDRFPEHLALKVNGAYIQDTQGAAGIRDCTLKGCTQNLTSSGSQGRSSNLKGDWVRLTC